MHRQNGVISQDAASHQPSVHIAMTINTERAHSTIAAGSRQRNAGMVPGGREKAKNISKIIRYVMGVVIGQRLWIMSWLIRVIWWCFGIKLIGSHYVRAVIIQRVEGVNDG